MAGKEKRREGGTHWEKKRGVTNTQISFLALLKGSLLSRRGKLSAIRGGVLRPRGWNAQKRGFPGGHLFGVLRKIL